MWDGESYQDGIDIHPEEFYQRLKGSKTLPTSSQPSAKEFGDLFTKLAQDADAIVNVLVSTQISSRVDASVAEAPVGDSLEYQTYLAF